jgi:hypothetical protein
MVPFHFLVSGLVFLAFFAQCMMPKISLAGNAQLLIVHAAFFCASVSVSFPVMLSLALLTGLFWDALTMALPLAPETVATAGLLSETGEIMNITSQSVGMDLPLGYSAILLALFGSLLQGVRPLFGKGRWELPLLMIGLAVFLLLLAENLVLSLFRLRFAFPTALWIKMVTEAILVMSIAPLIIFFIHKFARWTKYQIPTGSPIRRTYGR